MLSRDTWDMQCPNCDNVLHFNIAVQTLAYCTEGTLEVNCDAEMDYDDDSFCACAVCYHSGIVEDFRTSRQPNPEDLVI